MVILLVPKKDKIHRWFKKLNDTLDYDINKWDATVIKFYKMKMHLGRPTKVKRALSADPRSIVNNTRRRKKKMKPPPSKHMKSNANNNKRRKNSKTRHMSNIYPIIDDKKYEKQRANSDNFGDINNNDSNNSNTSKSNNNIRLGHIFDSNKSRRKKKKRNSHSESIDDEIDKLVVNKHRFHIGDVVEVQLKIGENKKLDLARIRYHGPTCLNKNKNHHNQIWYGIECFKFQFNSHKILGKIVNDGSINGMKKLFCVKKLGYGTFIKYKSIKSHKCLWSLKISKRALKLKHFHSEMLINASKYGSVKVVKYLFKLILSKWKKRIRNRSRSRSRSNSSNQNHQNNKKCFEQYMNSIQTGFGYAVLNNHTKIIKIILTHCGSNNIFNENPNKLIQSSSNSSGNTTLTDTSNSDDDLHNITNVTNILTNEFTNKFTSIELIQRWK